MQTTQRLLILSVFNFLTLFANANTIGTEYQNFNPSITGLDFTTVHSSETLKPCLCNLGLFFNYAKNTVTYSDNYYKTNEDLKGRRANDYLIGADINLAVGLTKNWDFGIALPFIVTAQNQDPYGVSYFDKFGLTEIRPMSKYRLSGNDNGGFAVVLSANFNTIANNPFAGEKPGPTYNLEFAADTTTESGMKLGANVGYRKRNPGAKVVNPTTGETPPFVPFKDSIIFSAALASHVEWMDSEVIAELNGSKTAQSSDSDTVRKTQEALEISIGLKNEFSKSLNLHAGAATHLGSVQATPDARVYVGINYQLGNPVCASSSKVTEYPVASAANVPTGKSELTKLNMPVTAKNSTGYRTKIGSTPYMNCMQEVGYSQEVPGDLAIETDITNLPDGGITLCVLAKNEDGIWQPLTKPTIYRWIKVGKKIVNAVKPDIAPVAIMTTVPQGTSDVTEFYSTVTAANPKDYAGYTWKIGPSATINCNTEDGYSVEAAENIPATQSIGEIPDGSITACVLAKSLNGVWQSAKTPTQYTWIKKRGYELFRLNANVLFDFDKDTLQEKSFEELGKIARHLEKRPFRKVIIEGHTDSMGADEYNLKLSQRRADRVRHYLIDTFNFLDTKLEAVGKGEAEPLVSNNTDEGRAQNRRVEFKIYRK
ncbi:MAG: OmpA family protein [Pseudobdellovibrio sp.]